MRLRTGAVSYPPQMCIRDRSRLALLVAELVHTQIYEIYIWNNIEGKLVHVSHSLLTVSYTHLAVYKRQENDILRDVLLEDERVPSTNELAAPLGLTLLPEIHAAYEEIIYKTLADKGYATYDSVSYTHIIDSGFLWQDHMSVQVRTARGRTGTYTNL